MKRISDRLSEKGATLKKTAKTDNSSDPKTLCYNILSTICILTLATVLAF